MPEENLETKTQSADAGKQKEYLFYKRFSYVAGVLVFASLVVGTFYLAPEADKNKLKQEHAYCQRLLKKAIDEQARAYILRNVYPPGSEDNCLRIERLYQESLK